MSLDIFRRDNPMSGKSAFPFRNLSCQEIVVGKSLSGKGMFLKHVSAKILRQRVKKLVYYILHTI